MAYDINQKSQSFGLLHQTFLRGGILVLGSIFLGAVLSFWWLIITGLIGTGFITAAVFGRCTLTRFISKLPFNPSHSGNIRKRSDLLDF